MLDLSAATQDQDISVNLYKLAGYGYTVIAPDYSGFSYGQTPGYFNAEDEAHAVLDATRAAAQLLPSPPDQVVITGHSLGGHAALSAQSYAKSYGLQGDAGRGRGVGAAVDVDGAVGGGHHRRRPADDGERLLLGPLCHGVRLLGRRAARRCRTAVSAIFQPAKQQAAKDALLGGECYDTAKLTALGAKPSDFFDPNYVNNVGFSLRRQPARHPTAPWRRRRRRAMHRCGSRVGRRTARRSTTRARQSSSGTAVRTATSSPAGPSARAEVRQGSARRRARPPCSRSAMTPMPATATSSVAVDPDFVNQWIAARAGIGAEPAACPALPTGMTCQTPPNDL